MGKMFNSLLLSAITSIALYIFDGVGYLGTVAQFFLSPPSSWGSFIFDAITSGLGLATGVGLGAIIVGATLIRMDWIVRLGFFTVLLSWVEAPLISLWSFLAGKLTPNTYGCIGSSCDLIANYGASTTGMIVSGILIGPLILYSVMACVQYIWSGDQQ